MWLEGSFAAEKDLGVLVNTKAEHVPKAAFGKSTVKLFPLHTLQGYIAALMCPVLDKMDKH